MALVRMVMQIKSLVLIVFLHPLFQMYNAKLKSSFDEVKRIAFHIEKAVRHKKVFCLGGSHFPSARKVNDI